MAAAGKRYIVHVEVVTANAEIILTLPQVRVLLIRPFIDSGAILLESGIGGDELPFEILTKWQTLPTNWKMALHRQQFLKPTAPNRD